MEKLKRKLARILEYQTRMKTKNTNSQEYKKFKTRKKLEKPNSHKHVKIQNLQEIKIKSTKTCKTY